MPAVALFLPVRAHLKAERSPNESTGCPKRGAPWRQSGWSGSSLATRGVKRTNKRRRRRPRRG
eukprot:9493552-Pyramimonas_sp.AAC.1